MSNHIFGLLPVFFFMLLMLLVSLYVRNQSAKKSSGGFIREYFIGSRSLGGFVLAMTTVATYSSVQFFCGRTRTGMERWIRMGLYYTYIY